MRKIFITAEIGNNHEGNFQLAKKMIVEAKKCGVDAVKFQTFIPDLFVSNEDKFRIKRLKKFQFSHDQFKKLSEFSKKVGIIFYSTPFDLGSARFLNKIQNIFKIASSDNDFDLLIETLAKFNKSLIISTGLADLNLIKKAKKIVHKEWKKIKKKQNRNLILMHCVSSYPVKDEEANLKTIQNLKKNFPDCIIGYSDHTIGSTASLAAVSLGAMYIEKHFTIDKNYSNFRDHKLSSDPKEMKELVLNIRRLEKLLGTDTKKIQKSEKYNLKMIRRKAVALNDIDKRKKISNKDIKWVRASKGFTYNQKKKIINKITKKKIFRDQIIISNQLR